MTSASTISQKAPPASIFNDTLNTVRDEDFSQNFRIKQIKRNHNHLLKGEVWSSTQRIFTVPHDSQEIKQYYKENQETILNNVLSSVLRTPTSAKLPPYSKNALQDPEKLALIEWQLRLPTRF